MTPSALRASGNNRGPGRPEGAGPVSGQPDAGAQNGSDEGPPALDALESVLAVVLERVGRLEDDVRHLRSQNRNRS